MSTRLQENGYLLGVSMSSGLGICPSRTPGHLQRTSTLGLTSESARIMICDRPSAPSTKAGAASSHIDHVFYIISHGHPGSIFATSNEVELLEPS